MWEPESFDLGLAYAALPSEDARRETAEVQDTELYDRIGVRDPSSHSVLVALSFEPREKCVLVGFNFTQF